MGWRKTLGGLHREISRQCAPARRLCPELHCPHGQRLLLKYLLDRSWDLASQNVFLPLIVSSFPSAVVFSHVSWVSSPQCECAALGVQGLQEVGARAGHSNT